MKSNVANIIQQQTKSSFQIKLGPVLVKRVQMESTLPIFDPAF